MYYIDIICHKTKGYTFVDKTIKMNNRMGESFGFDELHKEFTVKSLIDYMETKACSIMESDNLNKRDDAIIALNHVLPQLWDSEMFFKAKVYEFTA